MEERTENNMSVSTDYQYDKAGNRIQMNEYVQKTNAHNVTDYTYDANNRMTSTTTTANGDVTGTTRYYYDNNGNTIAESAKEHIQQEMNNRYVVVGKNRYIDSKDL